MSRMRIISHDHFIESFRIWLPGSIGSPWWSTRGKNQKFQSNRGAFLEESLAETGIRVADLDGNAYQRYAARAMERTVLLKYLKSS